MEFKFENSLFIEDGLEPVVMGNGEKGSNFEVLRKLKNCTNERNKWGRKLCNWYPEQI